MQETTEHTRPSAAGFFWDTHEAHISRAAAMRALGEVLYAIRTRDGLIKIGCTTNLHQRMHWHRWHQGSELLAVKAGCFDDEKAIHRTLVEHRARGREYYHPAPDVLAVVNEWRAAIGLDSLI